MSFVYQSCSVTYILVLFSGLPLSDDIEGPSTTDVDFIVGARPITHGTDSNFVGQLAGLVIVPHEAPTGLSGCIFQCLETMTVDTTGTSILADSFDQQERQLLLYGPARPEVFQSVLQTVRYTTLAPDINAASIEVDVFDGINSTVETIDVVQGMMRRKREVREINEPKLQQAPIEDHHTVYPREDSKNTKEEKKTTSPLSSYWLFIVIAQCSVGMLLAIVVVWAVRRKQLPETLA